MNKKIQLFIYIDGINDIPFYGVDFEEYHVDNTEFVTSDGFVLNVVHSNEQIELYDFTYDAKRMGDAPTISATLMYDQCLDSLWSDNIYALFNGEKFFLKQTPTSSYSSDDSRYKHELDLVSERYILNNVYFYDVVASDVENDKPVSNSSNVTFFGDINEFAKRMNYSLQYANLQNTDEDGNFVSGYRVIVDDGVEADAQLLSFDNQFMANVLQEVYNTFNVPYYFVGKDIHIGDSPNKIETPFQYGINDALLSITKNNANFKVVNRATGIGSTDNIPYYYPNATERGDLTVLLNGESADIKITNNTAINKFSLNDTLRYVVNNEGYFADFYADAEKKPIIEDISDEAGEQHYVYQSSKFYIPLSALAVDTNIEVQVNDRNAKNIHIRLIHEKMTLWNVDTNSADLYTYTQYLTSGEYILVVNLDTTIHPFPEDYIGNIVRTRIYQADNSITQYWTRNGRWVSLKDLGIKIPEGVELSNGDTLTIRQDRYIKPQTNLMPPIYRQTKGAERFYNALNYSHTKPNTNPIEWYTFNNPYIAGKPKEQIVSFEEIKPTIVGIKNANGNLIGMFTEFAYDLDDNDETEDIDGTTYYKHPFFFGKLRKFNGANGFNLFEHSIDEEEMVISFTDGSCGACEFTIVVSEEAQENLVQVYLNDEYETIKDNQGNDVTVFHPKGSLKYDKNGNVICGREHYQSAVEAQDVQNDTINNEVWVALRKDDATFGVLMPNAMWGYKPKAATINDDGTYNDDGDQFVILHIDLPQSYITAAENNLKHAILDYMENNNDEKFTFSITFSRIYLAENPDVLAMLNENTHLQIVYNNRVYPLYVSSYSYKISENDALPEISVELSDTLTIVQNALQNAISEVKGDMFTVMETFYNPSSSNSEDPKISKKYLRKDIAETAPNVMTFEKGVNFGTESKYSISGDGQARLNNITTDDKTGIAQSSTKYNSDPLLGYGYGIEHEEDGSYKLTIDRIVARQSLTVTELVIQEYSSVSGALVVSHANGVLSNVKTVLIDGIEYYQLFLKDWGINSLFEVGDFIRCSKFDRKTTNLGGYWVEIADVEPTQGFIVARKSDFAHTPEIQDVIVQFGSTNPHRQGLVLISVEDAKPRIDAYDGINSTDQNSLKKALKSRFGKLDGIVDNGTELSGYGVYTDKLYIGIGENVSTKFTVLEDSISLTVNGLKGTGIDIKNKKVTITADNFVVQNQDGTQTALVDENGKLSTNVIDADKLFTQRIIALDKNVDPPQVVTTINAVGNDGRYYTHYPVRYNGSEPDRDTVWDEVDGYYIGIPASSTGYDEETDSVITVYDPRGKVRWRMVVGNQNENNFGIVGTNDKWFATALKRISNDASTAPDVLEVDFAKLLYPTSVNISKDQSTNEWVAIPTYSNTIIGGIDYGGVIPVAYKEFVPGANSPYEPYRNFVKSWDTSISSLKDDFVFESNITGKFVRDNRPVAGIVTYYPATGQKSVSFTWEVYVYENGVHIETLRDSRNYI